jgi:hypothetical protein
MLAGCGWDEDVESEMGGLAAESAHLRPPLGGVVALRHGYGVKVDARSA